MINESKIDVRYPDADPMGIVHHAVYPIWYEIARMDIFAAVGFGYSQMHEHGIDPPMVNLNLNYYSPAHYPGTVTVRTKMIFCAPKKLKIKYEVFLQNGEKPIADATSFHIWTGPDMKSLDMSAAMPEVYARLQGAIEPE